MAQTLVPPSVSGYDMQYAPHGVTGVEFNGNQYIFAVEGNEGINHHQKIHVQKSTNSGLSWSETGTIDFSFASTGVVMSYTVCVDGSTVYILATNTWGANSDNATTDLCTPLQLWTYNLSTDTISGPSSPSGAPQCYKFWHDLTPNGFQVSKCVPLHLVRRGAGDMLLVFSGAPEAIGSSKFARLYVSTFNGSTISGPTLISGQAGTSTAYTCSAVDVDSAGYLHIVGTSTPSPTNVYYHISMSPAGSFGSMQTVENSTFFSSHVDPQEEISRLVIFGSNIGFVGVRQDGADGAIYFYTAVGGAANPTWTAHPIGNTTPVVINPRTTSCVSTSAAYLAPSSQIHVFWTRSGSSGSWGASSVLGAIRRSFANIGSLGSWSAEDTVLDYTLVTGSWSASNVNAWAGATAGIGVFGTFDKNDGSEFGSFIAIAPGGGGGGGSTNVTESISDTISLSDVGANNPGISPHTGAPLTASCGSPPTLTVGQGAVYRPPVFLGAIGLGPIYDLNGTLVWTFPAPSAPGFSFDTDPASPTFGYLRGTPTVAGSFDFGFTVTTPADGQSVTVTGCPLVVNPKPVTGGTPPVGGGPPGSLPGILPRPNPQVNTGMGNCIFEFYEMQSPEDVEVLPVPKKYDQMGPVRFDKIGKIFGFRIRLIQNGTTAVMPYAIYGDDSTSSPHLNTLLFSGSFVVRPGIDDVYEIQLPKSVNTDIFRLTIGPVADSFHRYDVTIKVHTSGMKGQAKWMPVR